MYSRSSFTELYKLQLDDSSDLKLRIIEVASYCATQKMNDESGSTTNSVDNDDNVDNNNDTIAADADADAATVFDVNLSYHGKHWTIPVSSSTTGLALYRATLRVCFNIKNENENENTNTNDADTDNIGSSSSSSGDEMIKLLFKGKRITSDPDTFPLMGCLPQTTMAMTTKKKLPKIIVMATNRSMIEALSQKRSDPLIRGFEKEQQILDKRKSAHGHNTNASSSVLLSSTSSGTKYWTQGGVTTVVEAIAQQDREYKFVKLKSCTKHAFGHHPTTTASSHVTTVAPHEFQARALLERLVTDPGVVAIMQTRELVVNTLSEMDPIDDRLMHKLQRDHGDHSCLLGYNTNHGLAIAIKLRTDDHVHTFRPYPQLVATLLHELSHNWIGDHSLLFWTNFAHMRIEYLYTHGRLRNSYGTPSVYKLAGVTAQQLDTIFETIMTELVLDMRQHGLHPTMIVGPIRQRIQQLERKEQENPPQQLPQTGGYRLGGGGGSSSSSRSTPIGNDEDATMVSSSSLSARELALAAAERRATEQQKKHTETTHDHKQ